MRGASAESLATVTEALVTAVEQGADADRVAADLFGVADVLRREPSLRRTATDTTLLPDAKAGLVRSIFGAQLDPAALDLVATAVGRRWAASRDLGDALEELGVIAVVRGAEKAGDAEALEDELFAYGQMVSDNPELREALSDPKRSDDDKRALLDGLLGGRTRPGTQRLARQSVTGTHRTVALAVEEYQRVAAANRNRLVATATVARELDHGDSDRLASALAGQYGRPVHLNVVVDPTIMGGVKVEIGDDVIDGTVASRLDDARRLVAG